MWMRKALLICGVVAWAAATDDRGPSRTGKEDGRTRSSRFLTFNTMDDDIKITMDFNIPFLSIPIKRSIESAFGSPDLAAAFPSVNVNLAALALGGAVVVGSTFVLPLLLRTVSVEHSPYARVLEEAQFPGEALLAGAGQMLANGGAGSCVQRALCWAASSRPDAHFYQAINDIASNGILNGMLQGALNGTSLEASVRAGKMGGNCTLMYQDCPLHLDSMQRMFNTFTTLTKN